MPIQIKQPAKQTQYGNAVFGDNGNHIKTGIGDAAGVVGDARHHAPTAVFTEIAHRQGQELGKQFGADLLHQGGSEVAGGVFVDVVGNAAQDKQAHNRQRHPLHGR